MPRPRKWRRICTLPRYTSFSPEDRLAHDVVKMTVDEYETIRLIDLEGLTQEECADQMEVARTTAQAIYAGARRKLAECIVGGLALVIEGGEYQLSEHPDGCCGRGCRQRSCGRPCPKEMDAFDEASMRFDCRKFANSLQEDNRDENSGNL